MAPFVLTSQSDTLSTWRSNPFFFEVDPEGNQLPYLDGADSLRVESREVGVFRSMAGETDLHGRDFRLEELPLYRSNIGRGDFNIKLWPLPGPGDMGMIICQTCNQDPELGKWLRTRDFRTAISYAMDRDSINETLYLGFGTPKNWSPHPSTPYYPGDAIAFQDVAYDPAKANEILDGLGLTERDEAGYRLRSDGSGKRISFDSVSSLGWTTDVAVLMTDYYADVGIELKDKTMNAPWTLGYPGKVPITIMRAFGLYGANPWFSGWSRCCPTGGGHVFAPDIGDLPRSMKIGPDGAVPTEGGYQPRSGDEMSPVWEPKAPDYTYPADPSGNLLKLNQIFHDGRAYEQYSPERLNMGKEIFSIHALEKYYLGIVAHTGVFRSPMLHQNNFINIPHTHTADPVGFYGELYYFIDGQDNIDN
jgi:ABC-type transport system substrate-binding protein